VLFLLASSAKPRIHSAVLFHIRSNISCQPKLQDPAFAAETDINQGLNTDGFKGLQAPRLWCSMADTPSRVWVLEIEAAGSRKITRNVVCREVSQQHCVSLLGAEIDKENASGAINNALLSARG
jgi:hypothetical protein